MRCGWGGGVSALHLCPVLNNSLQEKQPAKRGGGAGGSQRGTSCFLLGVFVAVSLNQMSEKRAGEVCAVEGQNSGGSRLRFPPPVEDQAPIASLI